MKRLLLGFIILTGCHSGNETIHPEQVMAESFVQAFESAVKSGDSKAVYRMLNDDIGMSESEFDGYFAANRELFELYAQNLAVQIQSNDIVFSAQSTDDPCGTASLEPTSDGGWRLSEVPGRGAGESESERKEALFRSIRSYAFLTALNQHAAQHPECNGICQRNVRREIEYGHFSVEDIEFKNNMAVIRFGDSAVMQMVCSSQGWRIYKCSATP